MSPPSRSVMPAPALLNSAASQALEIAVIVVQWHYALICEKSVPFVPLNRVGRLAAGSTATCDGKKPGSENLGQRPAGYRDNEPPMVSNGPCRSLGDKSS